jgi:flagellar biosynthesis/type III secretory pathway ATPase
LVTSAGGSNVGRLAEYFRNQSQRVLLLMD